MILNSSFSEKELERLKLRLRNAIVQALEARFGKWLPGPIPRPLDLRPLPSPAKSQTIYLIDRPGAERSVVSVGWIGTAVREAERYSLGILSNELASRIDAP